MDFSLEAARPSFGSLRGKTSYPKPVKQKVISLPVSGTWLLGSYKGLAATLRNPYFGQVAFQPRALRNLIKVQFLIANCKPDKCRDSAAF